MADGVLTSSLEQTWCKLFFGMQALPKNRGACVDTWFWHNAEWEISHCRVEQLWYLDHSHPISSLRRKLCSKYWDFVSRTLFGWLRSQDGLIWENILHELSLSRRIGQFWYKNCLNTRSYATCGSKTKSETEATESFRTDRVDWLGETELIRNITESFRELAPFTRWDRSKPIGETKLIRKIAKDSCPS